MIASTVTPLDRAKEFAAASPEILPPEWLTEN